MMTWLRRLLFCRTNRHLATLGVARGVLRLKCNDCGLVYESRPPVRKFDGDPERMNRFLRWQLVTADAALLPVADLKQLTPADVGLPPEDDEGDDVDVIDVIH